jgi:hypothetical protein
MGAYTLNNSGCLGNEEMDIPTPEIFYFSSQDKWYTNIRYYKLILIFRDHLMACKGRSERKDTVDGSEDELTLSDDESVLPSAGDDRDIYIHNGDMDMDGNEDIDDFFCFFD